MFGMQTCVRSDELIDTDTSCDISATVYLEALPTRQSSLFRRLSSTIRSHQNDCGRLHDCVSACDSPCPPRVSKTWSILIERKKSGSSALGTIFVESVIVSQRWKRKVSSRRNCTIIPRSCISARYSCKVSRETIEFWSLNVHEVGI